MRSTKVIKIGLLGSDSPHAERFSEILNLQDHGNYLPDSGARIVAIWGEDTERTRQAAEYGRIEHVAESPDQMISQVDAVFCITRHGGLHLQLVEPYLRAGVPTFVDKPLAVDPLEAETIIRTAAQHGTPFTSFSTVRFSTSGRDFLSRSRQLGPVRAGVYSGPAGRRNAFGGLIYFGIHPIDMMLATQGTGVLWVQAAEGPALDAAGNGNVVGTCAWEDGPTGTLLFTADACAGFRAAAWGRDKYHGAELDIRDCFRNGLQEVLRVFRGADSPVSSSEMLEAIQIGAALERSLAEGLRIHLREGSS